MGQGIENICATTHTSVQDLKTNLSGKSDLQALKYIIENPECDALVLCTDVECYEFEPRCQTEFGITLLDTRDIRKLDYKTMTTTEIVAEAMRPMHFRIREVAHLINKRWVSGAPDNFNFGRTRWVTKSQAQQMMKDLLDQKVDPDNLSPSAPRRPIVILGHAVENEEKHYIAHLNVNLFEPSNVIRIMDTQRMAGWQGHGWISLLNLVCAQGISPDDLHNSGNDAALTMMCAASMIEARQKASMPVSKISMDLQEFGSDLNALQVDDDTSSGTMSSSASNSDDSAYTTDGEEMELESRKRRSKRDLVDHVKVLGASRASVLNAGVEI